MLNKLYISVSSQSAAKIEELLQEDQNVKRRRERYQKQSSLLSKLTRQLSIHDNQAAAASNISNGGSAEPDDPKNLQEVFAKIHEDGLMNSAVKMFDELSQDGLTHEALELFSQIKDKGQISDVVEAYVNAGQPKEAHKVYLRMLASGVLPNAYTYMVVIKGLAESGDVKMVKEAKKYVEEMVDRGMHPNAVNCVMVFEGLTKVGSEDEGRGMLDMLKEKSVAQVEDRTREAMKNKRGAVYRKFASVLYGK